mgnify:CR=1 FL=1
MPLSDGTPRTRITEDQMILSVDWGEIHGDINDQVDLRNLLNSKVNIDHNHYLSSLADVEISNIMNGNILIYDDLKYKNISPKAANLVMKDIKIVTVTTSWSENGSNGFVQDIPLNGIRAEDIIFVSPILSGDIALAKYQLSAWNKIDKIITDTNKITVYCFSEAPTIEIPLQIWVI